MQTKIGVEFEIDFAHTLKGHPKCGKPHGHTAKIIVEASGELKTGSTYEDNMVIEFDEMKKICWQTIQQLDHTNLDGMFDFPTSENIAMWIFENLKEKIPIYGVKFFEGSNKYCEITKDKCLIFFLTLIFSNSILKFSKCILYIHNSCTVF